MSAEPLHTLKVLGLLLRYPEADWIGEIPEMMRALHSEALLPARIMDDVAALARRLSNDDLLTSQENYVALFDRSRQLSLHLFEHVHGESRDRGQAMVDLAQLYSDHGLEITAHELPDYLPLFLEFLGTLPKTEALDLLNDPAAIITALASRLVERGIDYAAPLRGLEAMMGRAPSQKTGRILLGEKTDIDSLWAEPQVQFLGNTAPGSCGSCSGGCGTT